MKKSNNKATVGRDVTINTSKSNKIRYYKDDEELVNVAKKICTDALEPFTRDGHGFCTLLNAAKCIMAKTMSEKFGDVNDDEALAADSVSYHLLMAWSEKLHEAEKLFEAENYMVTSQNCAQLLVDTLPIIKLVNV